MIDDIPHRDSVSEPKTAEGKEQCSKVKVIICWRNRALKENYRTRKITVPCKRTYVQVVSDDLHYKPL